MAALMLLTGLCGTAAGDWPSYLHDAARSGVADDPVRPPLRTVWVHRPVLRPRPAWPGPAKDNFWHRKHNLQPRVIYDRAFHAVAADGAVWFGSSADDSVTCLDAATGAVRWRFFTEGPVRLAPTVAGGRVYVGSDDGHVYCLAAADGKLLWKLRAAPDDRRVIGNERMISLFPIRTGVVVEGGVGYCFAGLFPASAGVHVCAFEASTGKLLWRKPVSVSAQGYMLAGGERLFVPSGRTAPHAFARKDGQALGGIASLGGGYALVAGDVVVAGAGDTTGRLDVSDAATRQKLVAFAGLHLVARDGRYYIHSRGQLGALDCVKYLAQVRLRAELQATRKKVIKTASREQIRDINGQLAAAAKAMEACWLWRAPCGQPLSLILAGDVLVVGGEGEVAAYGVDHGRPIWSAGVDGRAYGLAAAAGRLLVSTSTGSIYCFEHDKTAAATKQRDIPRPPLPTKLDPALVGCWLFRPDCVADGKVRDLTGTAAAVPRGELTLKRDGAFDFLRLDGSNSVAVTEDMTSPALPRKDITAAAWVRVDRVLEWGAIVGAVQDNGNYEKGWLLGFRKNRFCFAIKGKGGTKLTYLTAPQTFEPGRWYHVAGTYNGATMTVYVDGKTVATSTEQSGAIDYPPRAFYDLGAYHDDNEFHKITGGLHEVRVYKRALKAAEVQAAFKATTPPGPPESPVPAKPAPPEGDPFAQPSPFPSDVRMKICEAAAEQILEDSRVRKGLCLVIGAGEGRWAYEIARRTDLRVIGIEVNAKKVAAGRERLQRIGAYGKRIVLHQGTPAKLPYPKYFANMVLYDPSTVPQAEVNRVLRPDGGEAWSCTAGNSRWRVKRREALIGAGEWTHGLADVGNTACSGDRLAAGPLALQWFGRPGPRQMIDRHHRNVPPLYKDGRLFVPGDEVYFCLDAYNGTILWQTAVPGSRRLGVFLDCSNIVVDEDSFYVAAGETCTAFDVATGKVRRTLAMPQLISGQKRAWGYLARTGDLLVGSGRKEKSTYTQTSRAADNELWYDNMSLVTSDYLFALDRAGRERWTYRGGGVILNTTITIGDGRVYFLESRAPKALANKLGRMPMGTFLPGPNRLVALDVQTGKPAWQREVDLADCRLIAYLSYAKGKLLLSGNKYVNKKLWYFFFGLDAATGSDVWKRSHSSGYGVRGSHGEQNRHPTIVGDTVYAYPLAYHLQTGEPVGEWKFGRSGHGCGGISASMGAIFWRGANPQMRSLSPGSKAERINHVTRPGCWINIIPAGGMVLIPEASSGCTCAFPMQTSLGYIPVRRK